MPQQKRERFVPFYLSSSLFVLFIPEHSPSTISPFNFVVNDNLEPCNPSPCGANALCKELNGAGSCTCLPEYYGDPYTGCRPECVTNNDCPSNRACSNNKCKDPCPGVCGQNAICHVSKHAPSCTCLEGYTGNPFDACHEPPPPPSKNIILKTFLNGLTSRLKFAPFISSII